MPFSNTPNRMNARFQVLQLIHDCEDKTIGATKYTNSTQQFWHVKKNSIISNTKN